MITQDMALKPVFEHESSSTSIAEYTIKRQNQYFKNETNRISGLAWAYISLSKILSNCTPSLIEVQPQNDMIVTRWGVVTEILRAPGIYWLSSAGLETKEVYVGGWTSSIDDLLLNNNQSSPRFVSASINYQVIDAISATYKSSDFHNYVLEQAKTTLSKVFSKKWYKQNTPKKFHLQIQEILQANVKPIGIQINSFIITSIKISSHLQKSLLAKQEATAYINAGQKIAEGALSILKLTLDNLMKNKITLTPELKNRLVVDLIYTICQGEKMTLRLVNRKLSEEEMISFASQLDKKPEK